MAFTSFLSVRCIFELKTISKGKTWCFAIGQFGWSLVSALLSSWLVNFYQPDEAAKEAGQPIFIPQGRVIFGVLTVLGAITALGRIFDALTDPLIASASDRHVGKNGRRIPFMRLAAIPFGVSAFLVFCSPVNGESPLNAAFLTILVTLFYLFMTLYCTPYNALIAELGATQETRMRISTYISFTYIAGASFAYLAPLLWGVLEKPLGRVNAIRTVFAVFSLIAVCAMFVPVFTIRERDYVSSAPSGRSAFSSLGKTFANRDFRVFVVSDVFYFLGLTMFQTSLPFFVTSLLKLSERYSTLFFMLMTGLSVIFYVPVGRLALKVGKKRIVLWAFADFTIAFLLAASLGDLLPVPKILQGVLLSVLSAPALASFGILPQAIVADIAESDEAKTGENRSAMFFAARTFAFKMGQSLSMLLVTALATIGPGTGLGYRLIGICAAVTSLVGGIALCFYREKNVLSYIGKDNEPVL